MAGYIFRRLIAAVPVVVVVVLIIFSLLYLAPGDPAALLAGENASPEVIAQIREQMGLNEPFLTRLWIWVSALLQGDFGVSILSNIPVSELIVGRLQATLALAVSTTIFAVGVGVPLGVLAAWKAGSLIDRAVLGMAAAFYSVPTFVIGYVLILILAMRFSVLPVQGYVSIEDSFTGFLSHIIMPCIALGMPFLSLLARITRATVIEVKREDYVRTAYAKGLPTKQVLMPHVMKNAAIPIITMIGLGVSHLLSGVVVIETVFSIPGLGRLVVEAILQRDYPVIQAVTLLSSIAYIVINLVIDISYSFFDPRIRY